MRSRYVEGEVDRAIKRGITQYVILGAGLDSFAYRRPDLTKVLRIFEVNHPATQAWKRARLQELSVAAPQNLAFVPVNFEKQSAIEGLQTSAFRTDAPAVFSWLGVTTYLTPDAIFSTLRTIASLPPGTEIIFGYSVPAELLDEEARQVAVVKAGATANNEPVFTFFEPVRLAEQVRKLGFPRFGTSAPNKRVRSTLLGATTVLGRLPTYT